MSDPEKKPLFSPQERRDMLIGSNSHRPQGRPEQSQDGSEQAPKQPVQPKFEAKFIHDIL